MPRLRVPGAIAAALACAGCGIQSSLNAHGESALQIAELIRIFTYVCTAVWVAVMAGLVVALWRRRAGPIPDPALPRPHDDRVSTIAVSGLVALTFAILVALTALSFVIGKNIANLSSREELTIRITGRQWWWEVRYESQDPSRVLTTANEIHIPTDTTVYLKLNSNDVIHSFWVPSLAGKMDLVPGRENYLTIIARRPGTYRGQCAEFCGLQHAHMGLVVRAMPQAAFDAWYNTQLAPASEPTEPERQKGKDVFLSSACAGCHQIRGTPASARIGPELTHIGGHQTIAAATLKMNRENLARWIADPQGIKPGTNMPKVELSPTDVQAVAAYLEGLK